MFLFACTTSLYSFVWHVSHCHGRTTRLMQLILGRDVSSPLLTVSRLKWCWMLNGVLKWLHVWIDPHIGKGIEMSFHSVFTSTKSFKCTVIIIVASQEILVHLVQEAKSPSCHEILCWKSILAYVPISPSSRSMLDLLFVKQTPTIHSQDKHLP